MKKLILISLLSLTGCSLSHTAGKYVIDNATKSCTTHLGVYSIEINSEWNSSFDTIRCMDGTLVYLNHDGTTK